MDLEEVLEQLTTGEQRRIEDDLDRLGVTPRVVLGRVVALAAGPAHARRDDPVGMAQQLLHDPRAASPEDRGLGSVGRGLSFQRSPLRPYRRRASAIYQRRMGFEPELRAGPPWVMEEMIWAQLDLPDQILQREEAARLASLLRAAVDAGEPLLFTGCGTSEHAARAAEAMVRDALPDAAVASRDAFEAALAPPTRGLVVAISHEAGTPATLEAARGASEAGARAVLVTAQPASAPAGLETIGTPLHDRSWCHTVAYLSPMLLHAALAGLNPERARELITAQLDARPQRQEQAARLAGCRRLLAVGSGVDEITAAELALKLEEAIHVPTTPLGAEKVLHGHLPAADRDTGLVLLRFDPDHRDERDRRSADVAAAASVLDMPTVELAAPDAVTRAEALLAGAVALQVLTLELCLALGTNPDLIRREQPLYRQVAEAGGAG